MISWLHTYSRPWAWVLTHVILGYLSTFTNLVVVFFFYFFILTSFHLITSKKNGKVLLTLLMAYLVPFEIICRMAQTSPWIPYELSKYLHFIILLYGIFTWRSKGRIGLLMLLLLVPALFYDVSNQVDFNGIVFNVLAPINLCLAIIYFYKQRENKENFEKLIIAIILPLISALVFTYIKTPDYDNIDFELGANSETTGGFGSNQVSTVFGLGMFLTFYLWYSRIKISGSRIFDGIILILFVLQGLLSFSRGGMLGGAFSIFIFLFFDWRVKRQLRKNSMRFNYIVPALILLISTVWLANDITQGQLLLRYQGETAGTLAGTKEKDLNTITTNRFSIFEGDFELFNDNVWGVGAGASRYLRASDNGVLSHVELSRLAAEHGLIGLLFFVIFTLLPFFYFGRNYKSTYKGLMCALYFVAWYTTFHAATRNFVTPLLAGLALLVISNEPIDKVKSEAY